jgi:hypothetical protein
VLLLATAPAFAWNGSGVDWTWQGSPVDEPFELNVESFEPVGPADRVEDVFVRALRTWTVESDADLVLEYGGRSPVTRQGGGDDDHDVVAFGSVNFAAGLAVATTWEGGRGELVDCDITVHRRNGYGAIDWHVADSGAPYGSFDLANTLTHELGHCLGLAHSQFTDALMTPYVTSGLGERDRHLTPDDRTGVQALYGAVSPTLEVVDATADGPVQRGRVRVAVVVANTGDGSAFDVVLEAGGDARELGDVGSDTPVGRRVGPDAVTADLDVDVGCPARSVPLEVTLTDARGRETRAALDVPVDCPEPTDPPATDTGDLGDTGAPAPEPGGQGCGCATGGGTPWLALFAGVVGRGRSRRRSVVASFGACGSPSSPPPPRTPPRP